MLEEHAETLTEIAKCYGCGVTKKAVEHRFLGPIKQEVQIIKESMMRTGPELTAIGASKGRNGQMFCSLFCSHLFSSHPALAFVTRRSLLIGL
jgi:hypothetical protein